MQAYFSSLSANAFGRMFFMRLLALLLMLISSSVSSQTIYGVGDVAGGGVFNKVFSINPAGGAATRVCNTTTLSFNTVAMGVSNLNNGLLYYIEAGVANPRINSFDPTTCANGTAVATTLPNTIVRATSCPDGRFYAMSNTANFFEINPSTGGTLRTLTWTGLPAGGGGDFACISDGRMFILATDAVANYDLYRAAGFATVPSGSNVTATLIAGIGLSAGAGLPNGLSEAPNGGVGCAAAPQPCLVISTGSNNQTWGVNVLTGGATNRGATGAVITDLSRNFPIGVGSSKAATPSIVPQGGTLTYTIDASNAGPGVVGRINVIDNFTAGAYATVTWVCGVIAAGSATLVTTACGSASGVGNINQTASLSINGQVRYTISATLSNTFTGTLTNVGNATVSVNYFDPTPTNNLSTVTLTVVPAAALGVTKDNGVATASAGGTVTYTVTFTNGGPGGADNARIQDTPSTGLSSCTVVSCTPAGLAACPATPTLVLSPNSTTIPTFPASSTVTFSVRCRVSATGL